MEASPVAVAGLKDEEASHLGDVGHIEVVQEGMHHTRRRKYFHTYNREIFPLQNGVDF